MPSLFLRASHEAVKTELPVFVTGLTLLLGPRKQKGRARVAGWRQTLHS